MKDLLDFFRRYSKWCVFVLYVVLSCLLLFNGDPYRRHLWLTSASAVASGLYDTGNNVSSYFNLREVNDDLNHRNAVLESEVINLREQLNSLRLENYTDTLVSPDSVDHFDFIVANVINNSIHHPYNYLTVDKGTLDGVQPEMGVIDHSGVVGTISVAGPHYSRVISLLNPNFRLSCKIKGSEHFGSLVWDGDDPQVALLEELPRHTVFTAGDTIVTSGYSAVFPAGLPVGVIVEDHKDHKENFFTLRVKLFADFTRLSNVQIVVNNYRDEILEVENSAAGSTVTTATGTTAVNKNTGQ
ncbi:MAG: rod shape-determining protein MreC [Bacteroidales bacterium]|nr:rod shape-determining protein MreC [Bacteroidales bacterium]